VKACAIQGLKGIPIIFSLYLNGCFSILYPSFFNSFNTESFVLQEINGNCNTESPQSSHPVPPAPNRTGYYSPSAGTPAANATGFYSSSAGTPAPNTTGFYSSSDGTPAPNATGYYSSTAGGPAQHSTFKSSTYNERNVLKASFIQHLCHFYAVLFSCKIIMIVCRLQEKYKGQL